MSHDLQGRERIPSFRKTPGAWICLAFVGVAVFFLLLEHWAHALGALPYLLLLLCPVLHRLHHRGHSGATPPTEDPEEQHGKH